MPGNGQVSLSGPSKGLPSDLPLKVPLALLCFWAMALGPLSPSPLGEVTLPFLTTCPLGHLPPLPKMGCGEGCVGPAVSKDNPSGPASFEAFAKTHSWEL